MTATHKMTAESARTFVFIQHLPSAVLGSEYVGALLVFMVYTEASGEGIDHVYKGRLSNVYH